MHTVDTVYDRNWVMDKRIHSTTSFVLSYNVNSWYFVWKGFFFRVDSWMQAILISESCISCLRIIAFCMRLLAFHWRMLMVCLLLLSLFLWVSFILLIWHSDHSVSTDKWCSSIYFCFSSLVKRMAFVRVLHLISILLRLCFPFFRMIIVLSITSFSLIFWTDLSLIFQTIVFSLLG